MCDYLHTIIHVKSITLALTCTLLHQSINLYFLVTAHSLNLHYYCIHTHVYTCEYNSPTNTYCILSSLQRYFLTLLLKHPHILKTFFSNTLLSINLRHVVRILDKNTWFASKVPPPVHPVCHRPECVLLFPELLAMQRWWELGEGMSQADKDTCKWMTMALT